MFIINNTLYLATITDSLRILYISHDQIHTVAVVRYVNWIDLGFAIFLNMISVTEKVAIVALQNLGHFLVH